MSISYIEKLSDPRWQRKRLEIFQRDNFTCMCCDRSDLPLHVHHIYYFPGVDPWNYKNEHLITYCEICHESEHLIGNQINDCLMEIIKENKIFIKPLAQLCILTEKYPPFIEKLKAFLNTELVSYLENKKQNTNAQ